MTAEIVESDHALEFTHDDAYEYSLLVEKAIKARKALDIGRWLLGDYVRKLITDFSKYRECTIENFADAIMIEAHRLYEYASMASFYSLEKREELSDLDLCYSHYREARRLRDIDKAVEFLKTISLYRWTVQQTRDALKALRMKGHVVAENFGDAPPMTDLRNLPYERRPSYQWRGPAIVTRGKDGGVMLNCQLPDDIEDGAEYIVSFERVDS